MVAVQEMASLTTVRLRPDGLLVSQTASEDGPASSSHSLILVQGETR